jgi:hypothetical protein
MPTGSTTPHRLPDPGDQDEAEDEELSRVDTVKIVASRQKVAAGDGSGQFTAVYSPLIDSIVA